MPLLNNYSSTRFANCVVQETLMDDINHLPIFIMHISSALTLTRYILWRFTSIIMTYCLP